MKLTEIVFPSAVDVSDLPEGTARVLQGIVESMRRGFLNGISATDNLDWEVNSATFTHGVPKSVKLKRLTFANSIIGLSADGQFVSGLPSVTGGSAGQAMITYNFADPTAADVVCSFALLRDGLPAKQAVDLKWIAPTLLNVWANFGGGYQNAGYMKDSMGVVHLRGLISGGTIGLAAFTLPAGYRPAAQCAFPAVSNSLFGWLNINTAGSVVPSGGSNINFTLDGVTFDTRS